MGRAVSYYPDQELVKPAGPRECSLRALVQL